MMSTICNLSKYGYENASESLDVLFNPIITNILNRLQEVK